MPLSLRVRSNRAAFFASLAGERRARPREIVRGLRVHGRRFERRIVKSEMTGRPGLNRVTGFAARSWHTVVIPRGRTITLVVFTNAPYLAYHLDDYEPIGHPRKNPVRVHAGAIWEEMAGDDELGESFDRAFGV